MSGKIVWVAMLRAGGGGRGVTTARGHRGKERHDGKVIKARTSADKGMLLIDEFICLDLDQASEAGDVCLSVSLSLHTSSKI